MKEFGLNLLHYESLPGYSFDYWLMTSDVFLDALQDKQLLDDLMKAKRGGICGIMGDRNVDIKSNNKRNNKINMAKHGRRSPNKPASHIWYKEAKNLYR